MHVSRDTPSEGLPSQLFAHGRRVQEEMFNVIQLGDMEGEMIGGE
jgi:NAD-specific glutamate dehydrogenase